VAVIIARAFIDNDVYKHFVDESSDEFLNFCKSVACGNSSKTIYKARVKLIRKIFNADDGVSGLKVINSECNVTFIIYKLLHEFPSAKEHIKCSNTNCKNANNLKNCCTIVLDTEKLLKISNLEGLLKTYTEERSYNCRQPSCNGIVSANRKLSHHIFIEMDQVVETNNFTMAHFPLELSVNNERYV